MREATYKVVFAAVNAVNRIHALIKLASPWRSEVVELSAAMTKAELDFLGEFSDPEIISPVPLEGGSQLKRGSC